MTGFERYDALHGLPQGPWGQRILAELGFLLELARETGADSAPIAAVLARLQDAYRANGAITRADAEAAEAALAEWGPRAREYEVTCAAHAHIDMNWMWGFSETAAVTIDTFRTMLAMMDEFPEFCFSQSQASVYRIVEQYAPELLDEIRRRVREGRWEVTASTWVENDKNMAGAEAQARHLLYTKQYLAQLLDIRPESIALDFEPDTFGHCAYLPELLRAGGIRYYYHCRGFDGENIYRWAAPSGAQVLVYREPAWYNYTIDADTFRNVPSFCGKYGTHQYLKVYGVGDHGGGPTRRDVTRLLDMATWPLFPTIRLGTFHEFFRKLERDAARVPVISHELNYVFTGCYTSQARIKRVNRLGEDRMIAAEALDTMAGQLCGAPGFDPTDAWRKILFNQFHDILPGSGVTETREYALGTAQEAMAAAQIGATRAMTALCAQMDTSALPAAADADTAVGAGVGFGTAERDGFRFPAAERGAGGVRLQTIFNPSQTDRTSAELTVWDWPGDPARIAAETADGRAVPVQLLESGQGYWDHRFARLAVQVPVRAFGYETIVLRAQAADRLDPVWHPGPDVDTYSDAPIVLENAHLRAEFDPGSMTLRSLIDRATGAERVDPAHPAGALRLVTEETAMGMSAWRVGRRGRVQSLSDEAVVSVRSVVRGAVRQQIAFTVGEAPEQIAAVVSLDADSAVLQWELTVDWRQFGTESAVPQLQFDVPLAAMPQSARCVTPFGVVTRPALHHDVPCLGAMAAPVGDGRAAALLSDCKYGFRCDGRGLGVTLIRASTGPDTTPDIGRHTIRLRIGVLPDDPAALLRMNDAFAHPVCACANTAHSGALPVSGQAFSADGAIVAAVKRAEDGCGWVYRLFNPSNTPADAVLRFARPVKRAVCTDVLEQPVDAAVSVDGDAVRVPMGAFGIQTVKVEF